MIRMEVAATEEKRRPYGWWFDSRNTCCLACSPWLLSTLSDLNEKTQEMLRMLEEDADTFTQRAEMYYEKRPQLISLVEDFYRAQRSLLEQFDHLRHDHVVARDCHISPLASSYKSYDGCFTKFAPNLKNLVKDPPKPMDECHEFVYESEVDDFLPEVCYEAEDLCKEFKNEKLMAEIMEKDKAIEEMQRKLFSSEDEVAKLRQEIERSNGETEKVKAENEALNKELMVKTKKLTEELGVTSLKNEEQSEQLNVKDEEKREVIRQLSLAIDILKDENVAFKKWLASKKTPQSRVHTR